MGTLRIIWHDSRPFADRVEAGRALSRELADWRGQDPLVLGIPRGGLVLAREIVAAIGGELDIALARKLRAPMNPELAIGAMSEHGDVFIDPRVQRVLGLSEAHIQREQERVRQEIQERQELYRQARRKVPLQGRPVVVTDDGLATGATMRAALLSARHEDPAQLICAVPVGAEDSVHELVDLCDELLCLRVPPAFGAVGQFYMQFEQVEDQEVLAILREEQARLAPATEPSSGV
jgi:predicted phosphoribosyltransferase